MNPPVNDPSLMGDDFTSEFPPRGDHDEDSGELHHARMADSGSGEGSGEGGSPVSSRGNGGCIRDRPVKVIPCPRCQSMNTKFCYYNNYSVNQPRHFCRNCQRYWTVGGTLRNVPVGGGSRKKTRTRSRGDAHPYGGSETSPSGDVLLNASSCMQQLSMLPSALGGFGFAPAGAGSAAASQLPFLHFAMEQGSLFPKGTSLAGLQEVPDLQSSFYDVPQVPQLVNSSPMITSNRFFLPEFSNISSSGSDVLEAKSSLWSSSPVQHLQALGGVSGTQGPSWEDRPKTNSASPLQQLSGYEVDRKNPMQQHPNATVLPQSWATKQASFWDTALLQQHQQQPQRPMTHHDRLVPHTSWNDLNRPPKNVSPNGSNVTTEDSDRCLPSFGYHDDVVSQPWVGLPSSDILF